MKFRWKIVTEILSVLGASLVFLVPFAFIILTAAKNKQEAALLRFSWPSVIEAWGNLVQVVQARDYMLLTAFFNSLVITVVSVGLLVVFASMVGFVLQRRASRWNGVIEMIVLSGLIMPPAVVPPSRRWQQPCHWPATDAA